MNPQLRAVAVRVPGCRQQTATGVFTIEQPDAIRQTHEVPVVIGLDRSWLWKATASSPRSSVDWSNRIDQFAGGT
jgi:hypothetical protein